MINAGTSENVSVSFVVVIAVVLSFVPFSAGEGAAALWLSDLTQYVPAEAISRDGQPGAGGAVLSHPADRAPQRIAPKGSFLRL